MTGERVYPVSRLDQEINRIVITNDGDLAKVLIPAKEVRKIYHHVVLDKNLHLNDFDKIGKLPLYRWDGPANIDGINYRRLLGEWTLGLRYIQKKQDCTAASSSP